MILAQRLEWIHDIGGALQFIHIIKWTVLS